MLKWIKERYNNPEVLITENGWGDVAGYLDDSMRVYFYKYYINNVLKGLMGVIAMIICVAFSTLFAFSMSKKP